MREILFRGKRIDNSKWVEGYLRFIYVDNPEKASIYDSKTVRNYDVDYETVGQYTGLKDKNGVKIFEGDILQRNNNPKDIVQVVFGKFPVIDMETESEIDEVIGWYCDVIPTDALSRTRPFCLPMPLTDYYINRCNIEVLGNIHDNPDLMEVQHENT